MLNRAKWPKINFQLRHQNQQSIRHRSSNTQRRLYSHNTRPITTAQKYMTNVQRSLIDSYDCPNPQPTRQHETNQTSCPHCVHLPSVCNSPLYVAYMAGHMMHLRGSQNSCHDALYDAHRHRTDTNTGEKQLGQPDARLMGRRHMRTNNKATRQRSNPDIPRNQQKKMYPSS